jgi:uncharacterized membrane protein YidH (DUF202 family)
VHYILRSTTLLILFEITKNCHTSGRNLLLHIFLRMIKMTIVIVGGITATTYIQNFMQHSSLMVNSIYRQNYWRSWVYIFYIIDQLLIRYCIFVRRWIGGGGVIQ